MNYTTEVKDISRVGVIKKTECGIVVNAKAFEMLARQYSNPIKAIVQELSANAYDAHVRVNNETKPFKVKLPNRIDPLFKIRDYGISMTPDTIYDVYINYMKSDKTNTNTEIGCFGIGSKTPFAYTDAFNITTFIDGTKRLYTLSYNEHRIPELNEFEAVETDEENGVEVSFAVKEEDFDKFRYTAEEVFEFYDVKPVISGNRGYTEKTIEKVLSGDGWYFTNEYSKSYAIMGNVAYPIDKYSISRDYEDLNRKMLDFGVVITVPIGSLNVTPSREALEYTKHTIKTITDYMVKINAEILAKIEEDIKDCSSLWSASVKANELAKRFSFVNLANLTWSGKKVNSTVTCLVDRAVNKIHNGKLKIELYRKDTDIYVDKDVRFIIKDMDKQFLARTKHFVRENEDISAYILDVASDYEGYKVDEVIKDIKSIFGIGVSDSIVIKTSELPAPVYVNASGQVIKSGKRRPKNAPINVLVLDIKGDSRRTAYRQKYYSRYWGEELVDVKNTTDLVYVKTSNYDVDEFGVKNTSDLVNICKTLTSLGIKLPKIYGVISSQSGKFENNPNATTFAEWVKTVLADRSDILDAVVNAYNQDKVSSYKKRINMFKAIQNSKYPVNSSGEFHKIMTAFASCNLKTSNSFEDEFFEFYKKITGNSLTKDVVDLAVLWDTFVKTYPIVASYIDNTWEIRSKELSIIINTVNAIDAYMKKGLDKTN